ncbi:magnetosome protein Mad8 [Candidatus Desulfarcum epimagneticum]|uniref:Magnetosome protein Mad8 n=1 Tax=uncultured Desulfobacteraceae bacterium TaxID=218296 RepID=A0A484HI67_9BACT|nr:magnetosome protein Mad8 [uncultured Desulfobacteraceae bacterium]
MPAKVSSYQKTKAAIRKKKAQEYMMGKDLFDDDIEQLSSKRNFGIVDVAKVGTGVVIGGGLGILSGVAAIAISASAAEIIIGGVVTKIAGVVGGAAGLGWGLHSVEKNNRGTSAKRGGK